MGSVERITLPVMRPKRPRDQKQTANQQEGFCEVLSHDEKSMPPSFPMSIAFIFRTFMVLAEGRSVSGLVWRGGVPKADRGYWISAGESSRTASPRSSQALVLARLFFFCRTHILDPGDGGC